ncbi:MAG: large-conductance mechanosensitive channel protein MscL [Planctomycetota bacterium]|nr:MAG: large-conductance mechanosensitive channel protein MscL [Planctomycetota bacterium]REJ95428.1 MAG: large-conductance mechanosensitive channel protein MscL [Planctomycetota bacterium]REK17604.1 MAG: large-conductance mechanosensitive channel protein MscL [Planctomycetota bacterium]REK39844.1 MAG: large-conductance mechanosensitive channel protein MscL [Planctomycetota bacterium]
MMKEFREFAVKGNVVDMAVGIIIGGAFGSIVKSLVADVIMPPIGLLLGGIDFSKLAFVIQPAKEEGGKIVEEAVSINYGNFINNVISFLIVAFAVFLLVKAINVAKRKEEEAPPAPTEKDCPFCCARIPIKATRCPNCTSQLEAEPA